MAKIQFIKGIDEEVIPDVRLTRSRDGSVGLAKFYFSNPKVLEVNNTYDGEITGMYLIDDEGELVTRDVNAKFVNGKPHSIEALYTMNSPEIWDRFIRFIERYAKKYDLSFTKANS